VSTPQKLLISVLGLACCILGIYAYSERMARLVAEERLRSAQTENARLTTQHTAPAVLPAPIPEPLPAAAANAPLPGSPSTAAASRGGFPGRREPGVDFMAMMDSPEVQQLMNLRARGALDGRYAALFKSLGLPPEQLERFQQLLLDKQNTARDTFTAMRSQGLTPSRETGDQMRALIQNANAEIDNQIRAELGDAVFAQYQAYEQTQPQRALVDRVQQRLSYTSTPLSDQQAANLVTILAQASPTATDPANRNFGPRAGGSAPITDAVIAQAQTVLSAPQLTALQQLQREQEAQTQLMRQNRRNFSPTTSPGPGPTPQAAR